MATQTITYHTQLAHTTFANEFVIKCIQFISSHLPRRCMILSVGLLLVGLSIPFLMLIELFPASLFLGFIGLTDIASGGILTLYHWGNF